MKIKSNAEMRVEIARDVIKQIKSGVIKMAGSGYIDGEILTITEGFFKDGIFHPVPIFADTLDLIKQSGVKKNLCEVCGKGALFVAHILRHDGVTADEFHRIRRSTIDRTSPLPYFSDQQWNTIEFLYEGWKAESEVDEHVVGKSARTKINKLVDYLDEKYGRRTPELRATRLIAIMRMIIRNKGWIWKSGK